MDMANELEVTTRSRRNQTVVCFNLREDSGREQKDRLKGDIDDSSGQPRVTGFIACFSWPNSSSTLNGERQEMGLPTN
jgi:hypothetical protein